MLFTEEIEIKEELCPNRTSLENCPSYSIGCNFSSCSIVLILNFQAVSFVDLTCRYSRFHNQSDCIDSQLSTRGPLSAFLASGWSFETCYLCMLWAACIPCWFALYDRIAFLPRSGTRDLRRGRSAPYLFSSKHQYLSHRIESNSSSGPLESAEICQKWSKIKNLHQFFQEQDGEEFVCREESFLPGSSIQTENNRWLISTYLICITPCFSVTREYSFRILHWLDSWS